MVPDPVLSLSTMNSPALSMNPMSNKMLLRNQEQYIDELYTYASTTLPASESSCCEAPSSILEALVGFLPSKFASLPALRRSSAVKPKSGMGKKIANHE